MEKPGWLTPNRAWGAWSRLLKSDAGARCSINRVTCKYVAEVRNDASAAETQTRRVVSDKAIQESDGTSAAGDDTRRITGDRAARDRERSVERLQAGSITVDLRIADRGVRVPA